LPSAWAAHPAHQRPPENRTEYVETNRAPHPRCPRRSLDGGGAADRIPRPPRGARRHGGRREADEGRRPGSFRSRPRAASLATALKDAKVTAIFATEFKRTQQTAGPLAKALGIEITVVPADHTADLVKRIKGAKGNVLVVGHSDSVPEIIKALGVAAPVTIADSEFDNLFLVRRATPPSLLRLHYR
jgi:phosphohistidine phosphatase SixA